MSKRYREVLEEVETPATRRAAEVAAVEAATETETDHVAGSNDLPTAEDARAVGPVVVPDRGAVATLVRPTRIGVGQRPVTMRPAHTRPDRIGGRPARPGNGPADAEEPLAFAWRGRHYEVTRILGHWREEEGWWRRPDGEPIRIEQSDLWRVEAARGAGVGFDAPHQDHDRLHDCLHDLLGVYELARRGSTWRLDRVWD